MGTLPTVPSCLTSSGRSPGLSDALEQSDLSKENRISKTWEHYHHAARHHEQAAYHYKKAAKYDEAEEHEKAAHHAYLAHGHNQHAIHHDVEAAKLHAAQCDTPAAIASEQAPKKKSAA